MTVEEATQLVPSKFRYACQTYTIKISEKGDTFGTFDTLRNEIELFLSVEDDNGNYVPVNKEQFKSTYYHELGHCINFNWNTETDEAFAQAFANFMMEYLETKE